MEHIISNAGIKTTVRFLIHQMTSYSEYKPKLDYYPVNGKILSFVDEDTSEIKEITDEEINVGKKIDDPEDASCIDCGIFFQVNTIQVELKNFLKHQEVGTDASYHSVHCRDCADCKRGVG